MPFQRIYIKLIGTLEISPQFSATAEVHAAQNVDEGLAHIIVDAETELLLFIVIF